MYSNRCSGKRIAHLEVNKGAWPLMVGDRQVAVVRLSDFRLVFEVVGKEFSAVVPRYHYVITVSVMV